MSLHCSDVFPLRSNSIKHVAISVSINMSEMFYWVNVPGPQSGAGGFI